MVGIHLIVREAKPEDALRLSELYNQLVNNPAVNVEPEQMYIEFFNENPEFIHLTRQRAFSYWNCYFQYEKPLNESRLAFEVFSYFEEPKPNKVGNPTP